MLKKKQRHTKSVVIVSDNDWLDLEKNADTDIEHSEDCYGTGRIFVNKYEIF